jgi:cell division septum initiation protein DivIVA
VAPEHDHITAVLRETEERLRRLASEGRLSAGALAAFVELSSTIQREADRRKGEERRAAARLTEDRRGSESRDGSEVLDTGAVPR